ncbi:hypothetical protein [Flavivirga spongiicola]|uniref:Uncharacterized protein n=1 Tax=Flavivirga spongiicola TaxID=421621 RepID=A0ABU7XSL9_9FLAO|nr:hypothetical protein [Flavivirga sp. MEBiC05379]MDO5978761.1 hypothetical protein [Flavivirga sp. MEBiC05379]
MTTKKPSYELAEVTCAKKECNETFNVIISSIYTVVSRPVGAIEFNLSKHNEIAKTNMIDDYIVIKCACGHSQRVYLKKK